jgi:tRNA modification GTPase
VRVYRYAKGMADASTIFALSSGSGKAGIAVIRVSGPQVRSVMRAMASPEIADRQAAFRRIVHPASRALLDRAVVVFFAGPASETGEDVVEFQVHGGRAVVRAVLDALAQVPGLRMAEPGEFARRAFNNGKIDLVEVEALADLVNAETEAQRRMVVRSGSAVSRLYELWRAQLIEIAALTEAAIDFSDEGDVGAKAFDAARGRAQPLRAALAAHLDDGHRGEILRDGFRVALLGAPNAGKSSLLNALARRDAAIVSDEAGTTRDVIEVRLDLDGYPVIVSDTAGIRVAESQVEQEGIRRSLAAARAADLNLWLTEPGSDAMAHSIPDSISRETIRFVRTKADLGHSFGDGLPISTKTGEGIDSLIAMIAAHAADAIGAETSEPAVARTRHRHHLELALASLDDFLAGKPELVELRAEDVRRAGHALGRITGRVDVEDVLGQIFSTFCIGK